MTDITYIKTHEGWLYLCVVIDLFSRRVVGWSAQSRMTTDLALQALLMAVWRRKPKVTQIYKKTGNLRPVQLLLGHTKMDSTVRYLGVALEDALAIAEAIEIQAFGPFARKAQSRHPAPHGNAATAPEKRSFSEPKEAAKNISV